MFGPKGRVHGLKFANDRREELEERAEFFTKEGEAFDMFVETADASDLEAEIDFSIAEVIQVCNPAEYSNPADLVATITPFDKLSDLHKEAMKDYGYAAWCKSLDGEQPRRIVDANVLGASENYDTRLDLYRVALLSAGVHDMHAWYLETIKKQEDEMTQFEKDAVTAIINHCKSLNTHDHGEVASFLMGYPTLHDKSARPTSSRVAFANNTGYTFPDYPTYRFHPKGYEPGGPMPRYRLKTTHNVYMNELSTNNRLLGTAKPWASWHRWPGWRIGALATFAFIVVDHHFWGIKASLAHHHHHYDAREHHMYGLPSYTADGRLLKGNMIYKMEE